VSLTSVLASDKILAARLASLVPSSSIPDVSELPLRAPPLTTHYSLVGTAFDYLLRFELERRNHRVVVKPWVAEHAVELAQAGSEVEDFTVLRWPAEANRTELTNSFASSLAGAKASYANFIRLAEPSPNDYQAVAAQAIRLAKLDPIYRAGYIDLDPLAFDPADVTDLTTLLRLVPFSDSMRVCLDRSVLLNPTFGRFSTGIGGADADLVAGDALVDIKTTKNPQLKPHLAQIVGYSVLAEAYRREEMPDFPELRQIGIYYARQGFLHQISLETVRSARDYSGASADLIGRCTRVKMSLDDVLLGKSSPNTPDEPPGTSRKERASKPRPPRRRRRET
jgi:hypothetical protein